MNPSSAAGGAVWSDDLTDAGLKMLLASGEDPKDGRGFGVELRGSDWAVARTLVKHGLGWTEGGAPLCRVGSARQATVSIDRAPRERPETAGCCGALA